jgi:hypothetical protein
LSQLTLRSAKNNFTIWKWPFGGSIIILTGDLGWL